MQKICEGDEIKINLTDGHELVGTVEKLYQDGSFLLDETIAFGEQIYIAADEANESTSAEYSRIRAS